MKKSKTNIQNITYKALTDPDFKKKLKDDPKAALEAEFGIKLPPEWNVKVHEDTPKTLNLVIPYFEGEMSDEDLQTLAGGALDPLLVLRYYQSHPEEYEGLKPAAKTRIDALYEKFKHLPP